MAADSHISDPDHMMFHAFLVGSIQPHRRLHCKSAATDGKAASHMATANHILQSTGFKVYLALSCPRTLDAES
jgi:hypothetical protein